MVILADFFVCPVEKIFSIDEKCKSLDVHFICTSIVGLFGFVFNDFGRESFTILDTTGEPPLSGIITGMTRLSTDHSDRELLLTCVEDVRHQLEDNDVIIFKASPSCLPLLLNQKFKIRVVDAFSFAITVDDSVLDQLSKWTTTSHGEYVQVKQFRTRSFVTKRYENMNYLLCMCIYVSHFLLYFCLSLCRNV